MTVSKSAGKWISFGPKPDHVCNKPWLAPWVKTGAVWECGRCHEQWGVTEHPNRSDGEREWTLVAKVAPPVESEPSRLAEALMDELKTAYAGGHRGIIKSRNDRERVLADLAVIGWTVDQLDSSGHLRPASDETTASYQSGSLRCDQHDHTHP